MFSKFNFPNIPPITAYWRAIYLEPILYSGEKITIFIIIKDENNKFSFHKAIKEDVIKQLFQKNSQNMLGLINYLERSFLRNDFPTWKIPFNGITLSEWFSAVDFSLEGILTQALTQSSSLGTFFGLQDEMPPSKININVPTWSEEIKNIIYFEKPELSQFFDRKVSVTKHTSFTYDFAYSNYISNFIDITNIEKNSTSKSIINLQYLANTFTKTSEREIILHFPLDTQKNNRSHNQQAKQIERLELFENTLRNNDIKLFKASSTNVAVEHILEKVA